MKKLILTFFVFTGLLVMNFSLQAQVINVPSKSQKDFNKRYPEAKNAVWSNNVANYTAKFDIGENNYKAFYTMNGKWDYTEQYSDISKFPDAVQTSYKNSRIADWTYESATIVTNKKGEELYRVEAKKSVEKIYLFFDKNGKEIKSAPSL